MTIIFPPMGRTRVSKDGIEYVIALRCPWCGACTTEYEEKMTKVMERCRECDTEYQQGNYWFWVSKAQLDKNSKNQSKFLRIL